MKLILNLFQQLLLLVLLIGGGFFAYSNQSLVTVNIPYVSAMELPLWLVCFTAAFVGFAACFIILRSISLGQLTLLKKRSYEA